MNKSLIPEYKKLQIRKRKLIQEGKKLQKEHQNNVNYFINHHISDSEWQTYLEKTACHLAIALVRMKIAKEKMKQIRTILFKKSRKQK